ncbi:MAG: GntR family transcriptional regulator [Lachnospiraceae bacterium]|nr:GntR family transcriptional regulator [Lachnospiraceae bacterium]
MKEKDAKYMAVVKGIKRQIELKELKPGEKVQSENELSKQYGLSRQTIRHALSVLVDEGILRSRQGSGTYVSNAINGGSDGRTTIAVVMTYLNGYIFPKTIQAIETALSSEGYSTQIAFTNNSVSREREILEDIIRKNEVAGVIVEATKSSLPNPNLKFYNKLRDRGIPVLFINSYYKELDLPHVTIDDKAAGRLAAEYLLKCGHRKIAGLFKFDDGQGGLRFAGFLRALGKVNIAYDEAHMIWIDTDDMMDFEVIKDKIITRIKGCTAIIAYNDVVAYQVIMLLKKAKIRVPEDISVISIDDSDLAKLCSPQLTSLPYPTTELGSKAAENLISLIRNPEYDATYEFKMEVIERDSVKKIK